jgi:hypothetical protein
MRCPLRPFTARAGSPRAAWTKLFVESAQRGAVMAARNPGTTVRFEQRLPLPLEEVRARLGVPPHSQPAPTNADGWFLSGSWLDSWVAMQFTSGFGQVEPLMRFGQRIAPLVESGVTVREIMSVPRPQALSAVARFEDGGSLDDVRAMLRSEASPSARRMRGRSGPRVGPQPQEHL